MQGLRLSSLPPASLNSHVGHLAITDDQCLALKLESILKLKHRQRRLFSCRQSLNVLDIVSVFARAQFELFGFPE